jgi:aspartyl-tRNA(Asn)/glutamyl-tRNA(Gln) amidotransferase subunit C
MTITPDDVRHIARLAEVGVEPEELDRLTAQLDRIVGYVAQLQELGDLVGALPFIPGPAETPLRADLVRPAPLARPPAEFAPEFTEGFFVVPRLGAMEEP